MDGTPSVQVIDKNFLFSLGAEYGITIVKLARPLVRDTLTRLQKGSLIHTIVNWYLVTTWIVPKFPEIVD